MLSTVLLWFSSSLICLARSPFSPCASSSPVAGLGLASTTPSPQWYSPVLERRSSWWAIAGMASCGQRALARPELKRRPRNRNCRPRPCECKRPRPCERLTRAQTAMVMLMWHIVWDIGCATYCGAADMEYRTGYRMCYVLRRTRAHRISRVRCP